MIWILVYLPVAVYLWWAYTSRIEPLSLSIMTVLLACFCLVEWSMIRRQPSRPRTMMAILCMTLGIVVCGFLFR